MIKFSISLLILITIPYYCFADRNNSTWKELSNPVANGIYFINHLIELNDFFGRDSLFLENNKFGGTNEHKLIIDSTINGTIIYLTFIDIDTLLRKSITTAKYYFNIRNEFIAVEVVTHYYNSNNDIYNDSDSFREFFQISNCQIDYLSYFNDNCFNWKNGDTLQFNYYPIGLEAQNCRVIYLNYEVYLSPYAPIKRKYFHLPLLLYDFSDKIYFYGG